MTVTHHKGATVVTGTDVSLGKRIELARRRRGLSRAVLAGLVGRSAEWIRQVEREERTVDRLSVLLRLAEVLKISDVSGFLGAALPRPRQTTTPQVPLTELRELLYQPRLHGHSGIRPPEADLDQLRREVGETWNTWRDSPTRYTSTLHRLPNLIRKADELGDTADADGLVADTYRLAATVLRRLGDLPLALLTAERAVAAARRSNDHLNLITCGAAFAATMLSLGFPDRACHLYVALLHEMRNRRLDTPLELSLYGALQLAAAESAAATDDQAAAENLLDQARHTAERLGQDGDDRTAGLGAAGFGAAGFGVAGIGAAGFGPTDVDIHAIRVSLTFGRLRQALRTAETLDADRIPSRERRASHYITVARVHHREHNTFGAIFSALKAETACPEEIRYDREARELVQDLLHHDNALVRNDLWALAERTGIA